MKNIYISFCLSICLSFNMQAQKQIHLVHGYGAEGGDEGTWKDLKKKINDNCASITTTDGSYETFEGMAGFAADISNTISITGASSNDIAIAHSMGGVTLRSLDASNSNLFGGYITVGSPHNGAKFTNSMEDGSIGSFIEDGCKEIISEPLAATQIIGGFANLPIEGVPIVGDILPVIYAPVPLLCDNNEQWR